jgi:hypothetical protein
MKRERVEDRDLYFYGFSFLLRYIPSSEKQYEIKQSINKRKENKSELESK